MSLEEKIEANTAALKELTALLAQLKDVKPQPLLPSATSPTPAASPVVTVDAAVKVLETATQTSLAPTALTYAEVAAVATQLAAKKGRAALAALFKEYNVANGKELKPDQWPGFKADCERDLASTAS